VRLLLTSAGVKNASIHNALVDLLGQTDRRLQRPLYPHCGVRAPPGQS
jgi:hypothetical protein